MSRDRETIKDSLERKGFNLKSGGDHFRFNYISKSGFKTPVNTKLSHGTKYKTIYDNILGLMAKQCRLSKSDFLNLIDCPLSRDEYEEKLKKQGVPLGKQ